MFTAAQIGKRRSTLDIFTDTAADFPGGPASCDRLVLRAPQAVERGFNATGPGGAPRWTKTERHRSGLIAVPKDFCGYDVF